MAMEEKKTERKKNVIPLNVTAKKESKEEQRYSYEDLNKIASALHQQVQNQEAYIKKLQNYVKDLEATLQTKRMDYLLKVIELSLKENQVWTFKNEFVQSCIDEVQEMLTVPKEKDEIANKE